MGEPHGDKRAARSEFSETGLLEDQEHTWLVTVLAHFRRDCKNRRVDESVAERRIRACRHGQTDSRIFRD